ncbi:MAG TPA: peptidoglycan DD-metalloendopeptidase family protein [Candidatus Limisoma intestinavium]|uniref:Peptidoglycan DD-metalloendopeptidase family protein n=1 Tax=Candidatus Limisoma intestinavium TaxID=2840856 RepID=A0A9D1IL37_9BACT|nr:peptidoglycan DD-metalloendopeptidase family protein [Candidatus Limisoma intestinavium]
MDELLKEEQEPEIDIYTESWNSDLVNPYAGQEVPDNVRIDVSEYAMPVPGYVTSPYGYRPRFRRSHKGIDLKLQTGDTVRAAFSGKVRLTRYERRGYGYYVIIRHHNGLETVYGHLSKFLVKPNQDVKVGDPIALGGSTGRSTGPHLHFETRFMGYAINPSAIFDFANQTTHTDFYTFNKRTYTKARNYAPDTSVQAEKSQNGNASQATTYRIRKGDTLGKIASRYGVSVNSICRLNGISKNSTLRVGKVLRIK